MFLFVQFSCFSRVFFCVYLSQAFIPLTSWQLQLSAKCKTQRLCRIKLQGTSICHHFEGRGSKMQDHLFSPSFLFLFSLLIEADLYQAPFALTPVTVTGYPLLHHSGLLTAEWQLDNPLWNDLGVESARPLCRWTVTPKVSNFLHGSASFQTDSLLLLIKVLLLGITKAGISRKCGRWV